MKYIDLARTLSSASILAILTAMSFMPVAHANRERPPAAGDYQLTGMGTYSGGACGPAQANFVDLPADQKYLGIGLPDRGTPTKALVLITAGAGGVVVGQLKFTYLKDPDNKLETNDFRRFILTHKGDNTFDVHFCFQADHGHGQMFSYDTDLKGLAGQDLRSTVFRAIDIDRRQFGNLDVDNAVLRSVKFGKSDTSGNATLGFTTIECKGGSVRPLDLNLTGIDCRSFSTCP